MTSQNSNPDTPFRIAGAVYVGLLVALLVGAHFPQNRIWGLNLWAYFPSTVPWILFGGGLVVLVGLYLARNRLQPTDDPTASGSGDTGYYLITGCLAAGLVLLFYLWRARTHFLGDGYTVLALLTDPEPLVKTRELGEAMLHIWVKRLFGEGEPAALKSFQAISVGAGLAYLTLLIYFARRLFEHNRDRLLFFAGMASCGFAYNFFGYVENYSVFVLMVALYCLTGLQVARRQAPRWSVLPMAALAILFHIFGVALIPSAVYLLLADTRWSRRINGWSTKTKWLVAGLILTAVTTIFLYFYTNYFYFRFAIVPLLPDRFTVEGYHLFSLPHLIDFGNLMFLLVPGLPIALALLIFGPLRKVMKNPEFRYLLVLVASCCLAVFVFDPKLGMPRDWDLFSFAGLPIALSCFYLVLDPKLRPARHLAVATMMTLLGLLVLFPRAISQTSPDFGVTWFNNYAALDKTKNMYGRTLLKKYYDNRGDATAADRELNRYLADYPQFSLNRQGIALRKEGKCAEAIELYRKAIELHPTFVASYANMGSCFGEINQSDSAIVYLRIAAGMNPYNWRVWNSLGTAYYFKGDYDQAEKCLLAARKYGPEAISSLIGLVQLYKSTNDLDNWLKHLHLLAQRGDAPLTALTDLAQYYLNRGRYADAAPLFRRAIPLGLDSTYLAQLRAEYPQLGL